MGAVPVVVVALALLVALSLRLADERAPLSAATGTATATVTEVGGAPDGRGLTVTFPGEDGEERTGTIELDRPLDVPTGAQLPVRYDPAAPDGALVHTDGDAAAATVSDVLFGLVVVALVLLAVAGLTLLRLRGRPRLRSRPVVRLTATHVVVRQGLLVRSWLELDSSAGLRWVPVYWAPELDHLAPGTRVEVHGDPARDRLVLPVVEGAEVWPSGRVRTREPQGRPPPGRRRPRGHRRRAGPPGPRRRGVPGPRAGAGRAVGLRGQQRAGGLRRGHGAVGGGALLAAAAARVRPPLPRPRLTPSTADHGAASRTSRTRALIEAARRHPTVRPQARRPGRVTPCGRTPGRAHTKRRPVGRLYP